MRPSDGVRALEDVCIRWWWRLRRQLGGAANDIPVENTEKRIRDLRARGVRIGGGCVVHTSSFSTEPYLVELGDGVAIAGGTTFLTHEGVARMIRDRRPQAQLFGRIIVGDNTLIGMNCIIHPGTRIGKGCVISAGSVVRGNIPDNALVFGNPARVAGRASLLRAAILRNEHTLDTLHLSNREREALLRAHFGLPDAPG